MIHDVEVFVPSLPTARQLPRETATMMVAADDDSTARLIWMVLVGAVGLTDAKKNVVAHDGGLALLHRIGAT